MIVDGLLSRRATGAVAAACYVAAAGLGTAIALARDVRVLWIGLLGIALAFFYHAPPVRLAYRGWGELAVVLVPAIRN